MWDCSPRVGSIFVNVIYDSGLIRFESLSGSFDSGASENFISEALANRLHLPKHALKQSFTVRAANGSILPVHSFVRVALRLDTVLLKLSLRVVDIAQEVILGFPFLHLHNPVIDWSQRAMFLYVNGTVRKVCAQELMADPQGPIASSRCTDPPYARPPLELQGLSDLEGEIISEMEQHEVWMSNLPSKAALVDWLCPLEAAAVSTPGYDPPPGFPDMLLKYADIFPEQLPPGLPVSRPTDHRIDLTPDAKPPCQRRYRKGPAELAELKKQMDEYLASGWIEPSRSPYGAGVLFARKKDGSLRLCIDYRALNKISQADAYPMPRIDELLDSLKGSSVFSKMDMRQGFHQIRVLPEHAERTAFNTEFGAFQFKVMPFGLRNAPATFQRTMDSIFTQCRDFVSIYLDDLIIHSANLPEHVLHLKQVFDILRKEKFYAKQSKCEFFRKELEFVGYVVGASGVRTQPEKVGTIKSGQSPHQLRMFGFFLECVGFTSGLFRIIAIRWHR